MLKDEKTYSPRGSKKHDQDLLKVSTVLSTVIGTNLKGETGSNPKITCVLCYLARFTFNLSAFHGILLDVQELYFLTVFMYFFWSCPQCEGRHLQYVKQVPTSQPVCGALAGM